MNARAVTLYEGGLADLPDVMGVMDHSFAACFGEAWTSAQCAGLLPMPGVWLTIARDELGAVGFSLSRLIVDEAELLLLAVHDRAHRQGIGKILLQRFERLARMRGAARLHLEVREGNHALGLYEKAGFALIGRRPQYYRGPDGRGYDALTLAKRADGDY